MSGLRRYPRRDREGGGAGVSDRTLADFHEGQRVRYVPMHAHGNFNHVDCEDGVVTSINRQFVFVRYDGRHGSQATLPTDLMPL